VIGHHNPVAADRPGNGKCGLARAERGRQRREIGAERIGQGRVIGAGKNSNAGQAGTFAPCAFAQGKTRMCAADVRYQADHSRGYSNV